MQFDELKLEKPVTTAKLNQLAKKGILTVEDMLRIYPKYYHDYRNVIRIDQAEDGKRVAVKATLLGVQKKMGRNTQYITAICNDESCDKQFSVRWFNPYVFDKIYDLKGKTVIVGGQFINNEWGMQIINPELFADASENNANKIYPIYKKIPGMSVDYFASLLSACLEQYSGEDNIDSNTKDFFKIVDESELFKYIHMPENEMQIKMANKRLIFESLYPLANKMVQDSKDAERTSTFIPTKLNNFNKFISTLPYELTTDQKKIITSFGKSAKLGKRINALIQGDVGSGKTVVAFSLMVMMSDNGYQSALMAPTGILAEQHYNELKNYVEPLGLKAVLLKSGMKAKEERAALKQIKEGKVQFIVGTHSIISDKVEFNNLALTIVDEEHKFGVAQRENLSKKADEGVHNISMSATPIPRSLALTIYGSAVDVYTIESMPNGRKPVKTAIVKSDVSAFKFMEKEIAEGHQCYIVCPMIGDPMYEYDEDDDSDKPTSVEDVFKAATQYFYNKGVHIDMVTGKMKEDEKKEALDRFSSNMSQILIATTIIEVGVNVPNATVITIMNAERFGLAGLHQLRGRVGRSDLQSYCMLRSDEVDNPRLNAMVKTTNGFEIAEEDLKLRGTGDFLGTRQSGEDKNVMIMLKYPKFFNQIKDYISKNIL